MSVNGISNVTQNVDNKNTTKTKPAQSTEGTKQAVETKQKDTETSAAVYEKNEQTDTKKKVYQRDTVTIDRLIAEAEKRAQSFRDLVEKMMLKQGQTYSEATDIYALLREGKLEVDPETRAQAQKDIAEDGYWGIEQTSERMVSFAKALTGGDTSKADEMIKAVKKGFEEATKSWGGDLPDISKKTLEATISKLEAWRDGADMSNAALQTFKSQAANSKIAE